MSKIYYLDTNTCIFYMRRQYEKLCSKVDSLIECIKLPAIVKAELLVGAFKSADPKQVLKDSLAFCEPFEIVPFDDTMTEIYGKIKASLEVKGMKIGFNDNIIAATVLARKGILVTNNTREFNRVDGLLIEDWAQE